MADRSKTVIVKKIKKGHAGHHGGSWKVAYADFVTAMMAFFLLLWLLTMTSSEKRAVLSAYFKNFSLFSESGTSFMKESSEIFSQAGGEVKSKGSPIEQSAGETAAQVATEALKEHLKQAVQKRLKAAKDQVLVDIFEGGVRIQIVDNEGSSMFPSGSTKPTEKARAILALVAENIKSTSNRIAVEGHTDSVGLRRANWDLSTGRASAARIELEKNGIDTDKFSRVVGYADTELLFKDEPTDPRNRRISLILLQPKPQELPPVTRDLKLEPQLRAIKPVTGEEIKPAPAEQKKNIIGPDLGIKSSKPIEMSKPIDVPSGPPAKSLQPLQAPAEQPKKPEKAGPEKREKRGAKKQARPAEMPNKDKVETAPKRQIDHINAIPELGR